jgi:hypothetical protein
MDIDDQVLIIWKRRKRKKLAQGKGILIGAIFVLHSRHHRGCDLESIIVL